MWERFSYYGMRGFLILYMTAPRGDGRPRIGHADCRGDLRHLHVDGLPHEPAGRLDRRPADRPAPRRALRRHPDRRRPLHAGRSSVAAFYAGLVLIVLGTGLLKPNISVIVGQLYAEKDIRRDAGFSVFYMGINLGAFVGPLITGFLAQDERFRGWLSGMGMDPNSSWHWGFGAAGVGMTLGLLQYAFGGQAARRGGHASGRALVARSRVAAETSCGSGSRRKPRRARRARRRDCNGRASGHARTNQQRIQLHPAGGHGHLFRLAVLRAATGRRTNASGCI